MDRPAQAWTSRRGAMLAAIAVGGIAGAALRWVVTESFATEPVPWGTLGVNVLGCLLLGLVLQLPVQRATWRAALGTGFCGGLTTFSTFAVEIALLRRDAEYARGLTYLALSLVLGGVAFSVGRRIALPAVST